MHASSFSYQNGGPWEKFESEGKGVLRFPEQHIDRCRKTYFSLVFWQSVKEITQLLAYLEDVVQSKVLHP